MTTMWQALASLADAELKDDDGNARKRYEMLSIATWELQNRIKELLSDYPGAAAEPSYLSEDSPCRHGTAIRQAARLINSLSSQPGRGDVTGAPGAIYTPKGDPRERAPTDAGPSIVEGASALRTSLMANIPSMRWDALVAASDLENRRLLQLGITPSRGSPGNFPTRKLLHVRVDESMEADTHCTIQGGDGLRAWTLGALRKLHSDVSLEDVHKAQLTVVVQNGVLPPRDDATWFKLYVNDDIVAESRQLLAWLFHSSRSSQEAWASITEAFTHCLVQPDAGSADADGRCAFDITPSSYQSYVKDLQEKMDQISGELLQARYMEGGGPQAGFNLTEKELAAYRMGITPRTYLQAVGQKLLHHAAHQISCMAELPERIPDWTLRTLYGRPFSEAVKLALQHDMAAIDYAFGQTGEEPGPGERVRGSKLAHALLHSSADRKEDPKRAEPRRHQQPQLLQRADAALAHFGSEKGSGAGGLDGVQRKAAVGSQGCLDGSREGKNDECQAALRHARSAAGLLIDVERDVLGFEKGLREILCGGVKAPRPSDTAPDIQQPASSLCGAAYLAMVREDVSLAFRELGPTLRAFLFDSVTSAVQACLAAEDLRQPPCSVPICVDTWPSAEDAHQTMGLHIVQDLRSEVLADDEERGDAVLSRTFSSNLSHLSSALGGESHAGRLAGHCASLQRSEQSTRRTSPGDRSVPLSIDTLSHKILEFVSWLTSGLRSMPGTLKFVLVSAALECLSILMDRLSVVCTSLHDMPGSRPLQLAFLFHSAACCVRRRLEVLELWLNVAAAGCLHDGQDVDLVRQHGEALVQADELISSIHEHIVLVYMQAVYDIVLSSMDRTNWCAFRPDVMRGKCAGPAVRVWHAMMLRLLNTAAFHASPNAAEWILGQILLESVSCMTQRYLNLGPTVQMLREYIADAVHLTASVFMFCQPIPVTVDLSHGGSSRLEGAFERSPLTEDSPAGGKKTEVFCLRVPFSMARTLAEMARELLTRAALLNLAGSKLEEVARKAGVFETAKPSAIVETPKSASEPPEQLLVPSTRTASASGGVRLAPLLSVRNPLPGAAPAVLDGSGKPVLPGVPVAEAEAASVADAAAMPVSSGPSRAQSGRAASVAPERKETATGSRVVAPAGDPSMAAVGASGMLAATSVTDAQRLELWTSWLPSDAVRSLTGPTEALEVRGGNGATSQLLIPLGDRMADSAPTGHGGRQDSKEAEGSMWVACLEHLAWHVSAEQVVLALARRHELHTAVGTEPPGSAESRRIVRGMARRLGLLTNDLKD